MESLLSMKKLPLKKLRDLYEAGLSLRQIGTMYKVDGTTVRYQFKKNNIPRRTIGEAQIGKRGHYWRGGFRINSRGYWIRHMPNHPNANCQGYVHEHRLVMEKHLGRLLLPTEVVHHKNEIRTDNKLENLELFATKGAHQQYHKLLHERWALRHTKCKNCHSTNFAHHAHGFCLKCRPQRNCATIAEIKEPTNEKN